MRTVSTTDVKAGEHVIRVNRAGEGNGPTVLFLHGSGPGATGMSNFSANLAAFAEDYDCLVIDQVGWGDSSHPEDAPGGRVRQIVTANLALLDELGIDQVHLVGNSLGGAVALNMVARAPARVGKVICMGSAGGGGPAATPSPELMKLITFYEDPTPESMRDLISYMVVDPALFGDRLQAIAEERLANAMRPEVRRSHELTFSPRGLAGLAVPETGLRRILNEVLLIHGREDPVVPLAASEWLVRRLPNARLFVAPNCAHWVQIEAAATFNALAREFLSGRL
jgi:2-hydroxymuconate-semialdehyde hydrolase